MIVVWDIWRGDGGNEHVCEVSVWVVWIEEVEGVKGGRCWWW